MKVLNSLKEKQKRYMRNKVCFVCNRPLLFYNKNKDKQKCERCQRMEDPIDKMYRGY